jgi:hypothetical protein
LPYLEASKFPLLNILGMSTIRNTWLRNSVFQAERDPSAMCHLPDTNCVIPPASGLFDDQFDRSESQAVFGIVTVTNAHKLGTILAQEVLGSLLAGYEYAFGSHNLLFEQAGTGMPNNINGFIKINIDNIR